MLESSKKLLKNLRGNEKLSTFAAQKGRKLLNVMVP